MGTAETVLLPYNNNNNNNDNNNNNNNNNNNKKWSYMMKGLINN